MLVRVVDDGTVVVGRGCRGEGGGGGVGGCKLACLMGGVGQVSAGVGLQGRGPRHWGVWSGGLNCFLCQGIPVPYSPW